MLPDLTTLLAQSRTGDPTAHNQLLELLFDELRRIARIHLAAERSAHTLQPTALVNEAFLRLAASSSPSINDRTHFLALMSTVMRRVLVDYARARNAERRGPGAQRVTLDAASLQPASSPAPIDLLHLDQALLALAATKPNAASYLEMHYFAGLSATEIAAATGRSVHMVRQDIRFAHAWLRRFFESNPADPG